MRNGCRREGLTRIDVVTLVLLAVVSSAMILGCMNAGEEIKRQSTCRDNLRMLSLAVFQFAQRTPQQEIPGYINALKRDDGVVYHDPRTKRVEPVSWVVMVLQELDRAALYRQWRSADSPAPNGPAIEKTHVYLENLVCPNELTSTPTGTPLSYAVNCGIPDFPATDPSGTAPPLPPPRSVCVCPACSKAAGAPSSGRRIVASRDNLANGVFVDHYSSHPLVSSTNFAMQIATLHSITDPKDKTIMLAENVDAVSYAFDPPNVQSPTADEIHPTTERQIGVIWAPNSAFTASTSPPEMTPPLESLKINVDAGKGNGSSYAYARPSSKHPGGVNMAFVGNNVSFMRNTLSYFVYVKLMTSSDERAATRGPQGVTVTLPAGFASYKPADADVNP